MNGTRNVNKRFTIYYRLLHILHIRATSQLEIEEYFQSTMRSIFHEISTNDPLLQKIYDMYENDKKLFTKTVDKALQLAYRAMGRGSNITEIKEQFIQELFPDGYDFDTMLTYDHFTISAID